MIFLPQSVVYHWTVGCRVLSEKSPRNPLHCGNPAQLGLESAANAAFIKQTVTKIRVGEAQVIAQAGSQGVVVSPRSMAGF